MQKFEGFIKVPHDMIQAFVTARLTGSENQLLWVILSLTRGYNRQRVKITLSYFERATSLNQQQSFDLLKRLAARNIILITRNPNPQDIQHKKAETPFYEINPDYDKWFATGKKGSEGNQKKGLGVYRKINPQINALPHVQTKKSENECADECYYANDELTPAPETEPLPGEQEHGKQIVENFKPVVEKNSTPLKNEHAPYLESSKPILKNQYDPYQNLSNIFKDKYINKTSKDISLKENTSVRKLDSRIQNSGYERINELISFSAQKCKMTIIGNNLLLLEQLLLTQTPHAIKTALLYFKSYQEISKENRLYYLDNNFKSFAEKFDTFSNTRQMACLLQKETRWYTEAKEKFYRERGHLSVGGHPADEEKDASLKTAEKLQEENRWIAEALYLRAKQYVYRVDSYRNETNFSLENACARLNCHVQIYEDHKAHVEEYENAHQAA